MISMRLSEVTAFAAATKADPFRDLLRDRVSAAFCDVACLSQVPSNSPPLLVHHSIVRTLCVCVRVNLAPGSRRRVAGSKRPAIVCAPGAGRELVSFNIMWCFGLTQSQYVLLWCAVGVVTLAAYLVQQKFFKHAGAGPELEEGLLASGAQRDATQVASEKVADGTETVMELDSLGRMRKFARKAASEDRILDNARAILIGIVIQSHAIPITGTDPGMVDVFRSSLPHEWGPVQFFLMRLARGGGWTALAFMSGFDDTRGTRPYSLTYREPLFLGLWLLFDFNWTMWFLPVFAYTRIAFCAAHWLGLERTHLLLASQIFILLPAFVDFYVGWKPGPELPCPRECFCPWQAWPWAQTVAHHATGWWVMAFEARPMDNSMLGHALIFIPCYWLGFYTGGSIFKLLTKIADEPSKVKRVLTAGSVLALYVVMFSGGQPVKEGFNDMCSGFWGPGSSFLWMQIVKNVVYYSMNFSMSLVYVIFIAAAMPVHLKYMAKVCFAGLTMSPLGGIPCLLNFAGQVLSIRAVLSPSISPAVETIWIFTIPFLFELLAGAIVTAVLSVVIKGCTSLVGGAVK